MKHTTMNATIALGLGLALTLAWLWLLSGGSALVRAQGSDGYSTYYVAPSCAGVPVPCYTTLQAAVDAADDPGDVIKVAAGTYTDVSVRPRNDVATTGVVTQVVYISKTVTIRGGYTTAFTEPPDSEANSTTLDAQGQGRVFYITEDPSAGSGQAISPTIEGLRITGGDAHELDGGPRHGVDPHDAGGAGYVVSATVTLNSNRVFSNTAEEGGGLFLSESIATLSRNTIFSNTAVDGGGLYIYDSDSTLNGNTINGNTAAFGGGLLLYNTTELSGELMVWDGPATLNGNNIISNTARYGGGLFLFYSDAQLSGNVVASNTADYAGGLYVGPSHATLSSNIFISNAAEFRGGGLLMESSDATLSGNTITANTAEGGGGLYLYRSDAMLTNNLVADNWAANQGSGLYVRGSSPRLRHTTIAHNTGGDGSGIYVTDGSTVVLTNSILVGHTVGISVAAGNTVTLEATLWGDGAWANGADWGGAGTVLTGTHNHWGDPAFVDPGAGDYHIGPGSAALDVGVDAGVTVDIDDEPRPSGLGYDLGADEFLATTGSGYSIYLPVVMHKSP